MSGYSENEDDPDVYESSGDEWDESQELEKKRNTRRTSQRLSKRPRITHVETSSDSDDDDDDDEGDDEEEYEKFNGANKKTKKSPPPKTSPTTNKPSVVTPSAKPANPSSQTHFATGTFVVSKKDAQQGNASDPPCIWKIDGKALLQKYEPFEEDGKIRHRNTSIYTGWSSLDKDDYASVQVQVYVHSGQKMIVEMNWDQLKTIEIEDSD